MTDERFKAWLSFWQFVLGTVIVGLFTTIVNNQIQTREVEIKEQEANAKFLEQVIQQDVGVRLRLAHYFSLVTRSPELRERWEQYAQFVEKEYQQTVEQKKVLQEEAKTADNQEIRDQLQSRIAELEKELSPRSSNDASIQARTYIHIAKQDQRNQANEIANILRDSGVLVPGIEIKASSPSSSELRYFRQTDKIEAEGIAASIKAVRPDIEPRYLGGYENTSGIRPRHFELWLGNREQP